MTYIIILKIILVIYFYLFFKYKHLISCSPRNQQGSTPSLLCCFFFFSPSVMLTQIGKSLTTPYSQRKTSGWKKKGAVCSRMAWADTLQMLRLQGAGLHFQARRARMQRTGQEIEESCWSERGEPCCEIKNITCATPLPHSPLRSNSQPDHIAFALMTRWKSRGSKPGCLPLHVIYMLMRHNLHTGGKVGGGGEGIWRRVTQQNSSSLNFTRGCDWTGRNDGQRSRY